MNIVDAINSLPADKMLKKNGQVYTKAKFLNDFAGEYLGDYLVGSSGMLYEIVSEGVYVSIDSIQIVPSVV